MQVQHDINTQPGRCGDHAVALGTKIVVMLVSPLLSHNKRHREESCRGSPCREFGGSHCEWQTAQASHRGDCGVGITEAHVDDQCCGRPACKTGEHRDV